MISFSVIVPLYNKERSIRRTIQSILAQNYPHFEVIVVNDGSTDNSLSVVRTIRDSRLKIIDKPNGGVSSARNCGIKEANGDWIAFFDGDDLMYPNALDEYLTLIDSFPEAKVVTSSTDQTNKKYDSRPNRYLIEDYDLAETISIAHSGFAVTHTDCICIHRSCFDATGMFNESYTHGEDLDMWSRLAEYTPFAKSDIATALYVIDAENNSTKTQRQKFFAPIAMIDRPRQDLRTRSARLRHGCKVFHSVIPTGIIQQPLDSVRYLLRYGDWVLAYVSILIKHRSFSQVRK